MGVDCRIVLPDNVTVRTVSRVVGRLAGLPVHKHQSDPRTWWAEVEGVEVKTTSIPEMVTIAWRGRYTTYHFEHKEGRLLYPRSTPFWIALGSRLIDFFGGKIDYNDCDATDWDRIVPPKSYPENAPEDGEPWYNLQERLLALKPLSREEIEAMKEFAAYPSDDYHYTFDAGGRLTAS